MYLSHRYTFFFISPEYLLSHLTQVQKNKNKDISSHTRIRKINLET